MKTNHTEQNRQAKRGGSQTPLFIIDKRRLCLSGYLLVVRCSDLHSIYPTIRCTGCTWKTEQCGQCVQNVCRLSFEAASQGRTDLGCPRFLERKVRVLILRKEVIQPHLPIRLPCYDLVPLTPHSVDDSLPSEKGLGHRLRLQTIQVT